jgi:hypothetical protein
VEIVLNIPAIAAEVVKRQTLKGSKEFAIIDPEDGSAVYRFSRFQAEAELEFLSPAASLDGEIICSAPSAGDEAPKEIKEEAWKKSLYWNAGEKQLCDVDLYYRKTQADAAWKKAMVDSIASKTESLKSKHTLRVRYKETDDLKIVISEAVPVLR